MKKRPRLRTIFILVNFIVLVLPLAGIGLLRLFDSVLIRQTETGLVGQSAFIAAIFRDRFGRRYADTALVHYPKVSAQADHVSLAKQGKWRPELASLDLVEDKILPAPPDALDSELPLDQRVLEIGRELTPILKEAQITTLAGMRILDINGNVVASTGADYGKSLLNRVEVQQALNGQPLRVLRQRISDELGRPLLSPISRATTVRLFLAHPIVLKQRIIGVVVLSRTPPSISQMILAKRHIFIYFALLLVGIVIIISALTSYAITRPINALVNQAILATRGEQETLTPLRRPVTFEVEKLSSALHKMAEIQTRRANYIKEFASHVSHEFKTPVTSIKGAIELLQDHFDEMDEEERMRFIGNIHTDAERIERLISRLLELAKADMIAAGDTKTDVKDALDRAVQRYASEVFTVVIEYPSTLPTIRIEPELLDSIFGNLIENVMHHGGDHVFIQVSAKDTQVDIIFSDNGPGISEGNRDRIFNPFFTTARESGGTGLGLAVIKTLLHAYNGDIELLNCPAGASFKIIFFGSE